MKKPRGRLFQDARFEVTELRGDIVEWLLGFTSQAEDDDLPEVMLLKPRHGHWQRFFLDAGVGFWEERTEGDAFEDCSELRRVDYGARFRVIGDRIRSVHCHPVTSGWASRIALELASGVLLLRLVDPANPDSGCEVVFHPELPGARR